MDGPGDQLLRQTIYLVTSLPMPLLCILNRSGIQHVNHWTGMWNCMKAWGGQHTVAGWQEFTVRTRSIKILAHISVCALIDLLCCGEWVNRLCRCTLNDSYLFACTPPYF